MSESFISSRTPVTLALIAVLSNSVSYCFWINDLTSLSVTQVPALSNKFLHTEGVVIFSAVVLAAVEGKPKLVRTVFARQS